MKLSDLKDRAKNGAGLAADAVRTLADILEGFAWAGEPDPPIVRWEKVPTDKLHAGDKVRTEFDDPSRCGTWSVVAGKKDCSAFIADCCAVVLDDEGHEFHRLPGDLWWRLKEPA